MCARAVSDILCVVQTDKKSYLDCDVLTFSRGDCDGSLLNHPIVMGCNSSISMIESVAKEKKN